jgi:hypothetical protein
LMKLSRVNYGDNGFAYSAVYTPVPKKGSGGILFEMQEGFSILKDNNKFLSLPEKNKVVNSVQKVARNLEVVDTLESQQKEVSLSITQEQLDIINEKFGTRETIESFSKLTKEQQDKLKDCFGKFKAENGARNSNFTRGSNWEVIKEFKGASHARGGIDIEISNSGIKMSNKSGKFEAKNGVVISAKEMQQ